MSLPYHYFRANPNATRVELVRRTPGAGSESSYSDVVATYTLSEAILLEDQLKETLQKVKNNTKVTVNGTTYTLNQALETHKVLDALLKQNGFV